MSETGDTLKRLLGGLLIGVGVLIAGASGLCSLLVIGSGVANSIAQSPADFLAMLVSGAPMVLMFGGIPIAIGLGLYFAGRRLLRQGNVTRNEP